MVEPADNIGAGAPGDGTWLFKELLERRIPNAGVIINDPDAVAEISCCQPGTRRRLSVGGKGNLLGGSPIAVEAELISTSDGQFELEDRQSHLAAAWGKQVDMGPCAVIRVHHDGEVREGCGIVILLTSLQTVPADLGQWRSQGIEPVNFNCVVVKAAVAHRQAYDGIAHSSFRVATPGPCTSDLGTLSFKHIRRPIYPLDAVRWPAGEIDQEDTYKINIFGLGHSS